MNLNISAVIDVIGVDANNGATLCSRNKTCEFQMNSTLLEENDTTSVQAWDVKIDSESQTNIEFTFNVTDVAGNRKDENNRGNHKKSKTTGAKKKIDGKKLSNSISRRTKEGRDMAIRTRPSEMKVSP